MQSRWCDQRGEKLKGVELLVYVTRLIGAEQDLVLWGGGNSSIKLTMKDHMGRDLRVLWVKGSGSDMKTITAEQFTPLRLDELKWLCEQDFMTDEKMVAYQTKCMIEPGAPKPSIETLLHAFLPPSHVYHTHPDLICALTNVTDSSALIKRVFGDRVAVVPYMRPGFRLAKTVAQTFQRDPILKAIILDKHGLITWGDSAKEAYHRTIKIIHEAEQFIVSRSCRHVWNTCLTRQSLSTADRKNRATIVALALRGAISQRSRMLLAYDDSAPVLEFLEGDQAKETSQAGPMTPDHILHTKARPLFLELSDSDSPDRIAQEVRKTVEDYRQYYTQYVDRHKTPDSPMLDPYPRVILIPGLGLFTTGKNRQACRIARDLYLHTMRTIMATTTFDTYSGLSLKEYYEFEYWPLELYKLTLLPPEKEMARRIVLITGAAGAIGRAIAARFVASGASVILTDVNKRELEKASWELNDRYGTDMATPVWMDVRKELSVVEAFKEAVLSYGGLDVCVSNAGIARSGSVDSLTLDNWEESLAVNATGHFLVCREAMRIFKQQKLGGNIVVVSTKNILAPGKEFGAYSASKAAQAQLARVLALEGGEIGVRVNMVTPDGILEGSGLWSPTMRQARAKVYGIHVDNLEDYCISRNLLRVKVTADDVAEGVLFLASDRSAKTTGTIIPIDGGAREAFPR